MARQQVRSPQIALLDQASTPATPGNGVKLFYPKSDGSLYQLDSTGAEKQVGASTVVKIAEQILASAVTTVTFANIPQTYRYLKLEILGRLSTAAVYTDNVLAQPNLDTANASTEYFRTVDGGSQAGNMPGVSLGLIAAANATTTYAGAISAIFQAYARADWYKTVLSQFGGFLGAGSSGSYSGTSGGVWRNTNAVTRLDLVGATSGSTFAIGSVFSLYGIS